MTKEIYELLHEILTERINENNNNNDISARIAYESALTMLEYANANDYNSLAQFSHH